MRKPEYRILLPEVDDLQELRIMLSERMKEWAHQHEARGEARGEALALQRLLTKRFGGITPDMLTRIAAAPKEQIDAWLDRVLDAPTLDAVLAPLPH